MPINPKLMELYPGGSIRSPEWLAIREEILGRAQHRCETCNAEDHSVICRGDGKYNGTYMTADGDVFDDTNGELLREGNMIDYGGESVDVQLTIAHLDHDPTNNTPDNLKALCRQCHNRHDAPHRKETKHQNERQKKAIGDLFDNLGGQNAGC